MMTKEIDRAVADLSARFAENVCRLVREHLEQRLDSLAPARGRTSRREERGRGHPRVRTITVPPPVGWVHAPDYVDRLVELVRDHPWPPRSSELQMMLGVRKDPFLRIAQIAVATGRIRREGYKAGVRYYVA